MNKKYVKVDASKNVNIERLEKYKTRFGYSVSCKNGVETFAVKLDNRLEYIFNNYYKYSLFSEDYVTELYQVFGLSCTEKREYDTYAISRLHDLINRLKKKNEFVPLLMICDSIIDFLAPDAERVEIYGSIEHQQDILTWITKCIAEDIILSNINVALYKTKDGYEFFPATEPLFDEPLVIDVLNWLSGYPRSKEQYNKALKMILQQSQPRDVIDNLRLALELFTKEFFNNEKSLENQKSLVGEYLTNHNVSKQFSNMYTTLFTYYTTYNNNEAKHNNTADEQEIDFLVYLTGGFMRFLIQLKRNEKKI